MFKFYKKILDLRNMYLIQKSGYFDKDYYKREYPDVRGNLLRHYYYEGYKLGNNPSVKFSNNYYLDHNADIRICGINPLYHYVTSGKKEGREIREYLGMPISDLYYHFYHRDYRFDVYLKKQKERRITLFLGNTWNDDSIQLVFDVLNLCQKEEVFLRIIYQNFQIEKLFFELKKMGEDVFKKVSFLKWNSKYLLDISFDEKIICNDFSMIFTLLNTKWIARPIYYYANGDCGLKDNEQMLLSLWQQDGKVICVGNSNIYYYQLKIESYLKKKQKKSYCFCFEFSDISVFLLQMYQDFFLNHIFSQKLQFYYKCSDFCKGICWENDISVQPVSDIGDMDVVIQFDLNKDFSKESNVSIYFEKTNDLIEFVSLQDAFLKKDVDSANTFNKMMLSVLKKAGIGEENV